MDVKLVNSGSLFAWIALCLIATGISGLPADNAANELAEQDQQQLDEEKRATWLETRNLEENFKELVYLSIQELISEGRLNSDLLVDKSVPSKRGRHQGFCFKKTKSGRFLPYICWKGEGEQEEK